MLDSPIESFRKHMLFFVGQRRISNSIESDDNRIGGKNKLGGKVGVEKALGKSVQPGKVENDLISAWFRWDEESNLEIDRLISGLDYITEMPINYAIVLRFSQRNRFACV